jgi:hypothetical protein
MSSPLNQKVTIKVYDMIVILVLLHLITHVVNLLGGVSTICREMYRVI